ncbi:5-carboxymethyl-2-hydroxymuconate isomerase [Hahella chejuensis KCTC 2396]|uniref:5-carboxymethyl-2-hydroxymuconate isomerase n=1 Tax=Hahella chejuensis (strain KCTC 2396) TaxID=349521 RepID=Q2SHU5_HAHCH|nr:5-carboxymethyl-2-hydroxymuconate Delta-isomerase [Hahella chejuensis]ABC29779.1 5-carboxymethyl-2-hydroxymuconate isomerase [Hahella chejuensis KCTC 2396]
MPHLTLEYTSNLRGAADFQRLFNDIHTRMMSTGEFSLNDIKSRAYEATEYVIGDGDIGRSFVHLKVALLAGRSQEQKQLVGDLCLQALREAYQKELLSGDCQLCVELLDIHRENYFKALA